jgi:hypothetical protein
MRGSDGRKPQPPIPVNGSQGSGTISTQGPLQAEGQRLVRERYATGPRSSASPPAPTASSGRGARAKAKGLRSAPPSPPAFELGGRMQVSHMNLCALACVLAFWLMAYPSQGDERPFDANVREVDTCQ